MSRPKVDAIYPLSPSQQGMAFESLATDGLHIEQAACTFVGAFDVEAFRRAWAAVMRRHAVLRTAIVAKDQAEPVQVVLADVPPPLTVVDWQGLSEAEAAERFAETMAEERLRGFELTKAPLMRLVLSRLAGERHRFLWTFHHILLDGWCLPLVMRDLFAAYGGAVLPPPVATYRDYVAWLRRQDPSVAEAFWRDRLRGVHRATRLGRAAGLTTAPLRHADAAFNPVPAETTATVVAALRRRRLTLNTLTQGVWALILAMCGESDDVVFGATVSGRPPEIRGVESVVGPFFNTVPVRVRLSDGALSIGDWLEAIQAGQVEGQSFEWCSAGQIHQWADLAGGEPLFETVLVFENYPVAEAAEAGPAALSVEAVEASGARTNQLLTLLVSAQTRIEGRAIYDAARLEEGDVSRLLALFCDLVTLAAANLDRPVSWLVGSWPEGWRPALKRRAMGVARPDAPPVPPRTTVELALVRVWEDVFGGGPIGVRDHFFALGGHSLLVLQVMKRIEAALGVKLPPSAIFEAPTIEHLALVVAGKAGPWSPLVPLKPSGGKRPLFAVHPLGGHVLCYADLMRRIDPERPLYGLQAPGLEEGQSPIDDMGRLAASYIEAIRTVQPTGPYLLCGYSFGGLVAYEMACQLREQGETVAMLALFDSPNSNVIADDIRYPDSAGMLVSLFSESLSLDLDALRQMDEAAQLVHVLDLAKQADLVAPETGLDEARRYYTLSRTNQLMPFPGRPFSGPVVLLRASEGAERLTDDPTLGWSAIVTDGLRVVWTPGAHETMLAPPFVDGTVAALHQALAEAEVVAEG